MTGSFLAVPETGNALCVRYPLNWGPEVKKICRKTLRAPMINKNIKSKINFIIFNHCDSGVVCHNITYTILTETGSGIKLLSQGYIAKKCKNQNPNPDILASVSACFSPLWYMAYLLKLELPRGRIKRSF